MNIPGVSFNNNNWLPIVRAVCFVLSISMVVIPQIHGGLFLFRGMILYWNILSMIIIGIGFMVGLFAPIYVVAKKYE